MALLQVVRHHQDRLRFGRDVHQVGGQRLVAEGGGRRLGDGPVHRPDAKVQVGRAHHLAGQALHQVVLLVRGEG